MKHIHGKTLTQMNNDTEILDDAMSDGQIGIGTEKPKIVATIMRLTIMMIMNLMVICFFMKGQ